MKLSDKSLVLLSFAVFCGRFYRGDPKKIRKYLLSTVISVFAVSLSVPVLPKACWPIVLPLLSFVMGTVISGYASVIRNNVPYEERPVFGADMLIYGNVVLIIAHILANNTLPLISFAVIEVLFGGGIYSLAKVSTQEPAVVEPLKESKKISLSRYWIFFLFIFVITINSGIMFQVIYPYFSEHIQS